MMRILQIVAIAVVISFCLRPVQAQWQQVDGPYLFEPIDMVEQDGSLFMIKGGPAENALFTSTNNAESWEQVATPLIDRSARDLMIIGEYLVVIGTSNLARTSDRGASWELIQLPGERYAYTVLESEGRIIVITDTLFVSDDAGTSWRSYNPDGLTSTYPYNSSTIAGTVFLTKSHSLQAITIDSAVHVSTFDAGTRLTGSCRDGNRLFLGSSDGIFYSDDGGVSLHRIPDINADLRSVHTDESYIYGLHVLRNRIYRINKTTMSVDSLSVPNLPIYDNIRMSSGWTVLKFAYVLGSDLYVLSQGRGVYRTTDHGETWTQQNGTITGIDIHQFQAGGGKLYAVGNTSGLFVSEDDGATWTVAPSTGHPMNTFALASNGESVYAFGALFDMYVLSDNGTNWDLVATPLAPYEPGFQAYPGGALATNDAIFINTGTTLKTTDEGTTWQNTGMRTGHFRRRGGSIFAVIPGGFAWSDDDGATWDSTFFGIMHDNRPATISKYDVYGNTILGVSDDYSLLSTDRGNTWEMRSAPPVETYVSDVLAVNGAFIAAYRDDGSPYITYDNGETWEPFNDGLEDPAISLSAYNDYLYAGMTYSSIWRRPLSDVVPVDKPASPSSLTLDQNYPNPFSGTTTISYSLPSAGHATLTVTNALGQEVARLVEARMEAGAHNVPFNTTGLVPGVYFYTLRSGNATVTKSMLVAR